MNQIQTMYADCWQGGPVSACNSFYGDPTNSACIACMITDSTASSWGAIINFPNGVGYPNIAGCEALVAPDGGGVACAHAIEAEDQCRDTSCFLHCPNGTTPAGIAAFQQCEQQAEMTTCATEVQAATPCYSSGAYPACVFANFQADFIGLGEFFCAANAGADGGMDAPSDGAGDGGGG